MEAALFSRRTSAQTNDWPRRRQLFQAPCARGVSALAANFRCGLHCLAVRTAVRAVRGSVAITAGVLTAFGGISHADSFRNFERLHRTRGEQPLGDSELGRLNSASRPQHKVQDERDDRKHEQ